MSPRLAWLGLGNIGRACSKNIAAKAPLAGPLILYNRTQQRASDLSAALPAGKTAVASTVAEAVSNADIIFTCLADDAADRETLAAALATGDAAGKLFVDCSTVHPDTTEELAKRVQDAGAAFVACPVFGAPAMAEAGQLVTVLAGTREDVERVKPYTVGAIARADIDLSGQAPRKATLLKVVGNTFIVDMIEALAEGHVLAEKTGLDHEVLHSFLEAVMPVPYAAYSKRMMSGDYYEREQPLMAASLARKDARHAMDLAERNGMRLHAVEVADAHLAKVEEEKGEKGDLAGIFGAVRMESGLPFGNQG